MVELGLALLADEQLIRDLRARPAVADKPEYRRLVPSQLRFDCGPLRAVLSTKACAELGQRAEPGTACHRCELGQQHHTDHHPAERRRERAVGTCVRCGRADLQIVRTHGLCVSYQNREYEWINGRNTKGKVPTEYRPAFQHELTLLLGDGTVQRRLEAGLHAGEALARLLLRLPEGARLVAGR